MGYILIIHQLPLTADVKLSGPQVQILLTTGKILESETFRIQ